MYHKIHEPKLFKKGEEIPDDWDAVNKWGWRRDAKNHFNWKK